VVEKAAGGQAAAPTARARAISTATQSFAQGTVAGALLRLGVGTVLAMGHAVHVDMPRELLAAFYAGLARGWPLNEQLGHPACIAVSHGNLANRLRLAGQRDEGAGHARQALAILDQLKSPDTWRTLPILAKIATGLSGGSLRSPAAATTEAYRPFRARGVRLRRASRRHLRAFGATVCSRERNHPRGKPGALLD
jgi:hypothetical protein